MPSIIGLRVWMSSWPRSGHEGADLSAEAADCLQGVARSTGAFDHKRIQQDGEWRDGDTSFLRVNVWRDQAEHLADSLSKGDRVMVTGRLRQRSWETPEGDNRSVTEIEADEVGASLKWATAKVERTSQRDNGERSGGRERQAERGGDFNDAPPF